VRWSCLNKHFNMDHHIDVELFLHLVTWSWLLAKIFVEHPHVWFCLINIRGIFSVLVKHWNFLGRLQSYWCQWKKVYRDIQIQLNVLITKWKQILSIRIELEVHIYDLNILRIWKKLGKKSIYSRDMSYIFIFAKLYIFCSSL
jgi:hypothetical protein